MQKKNASLAEQAGACLGCANASVFQLAPIPQNEPFWLPALGQTGAAKHTHHAHGQPIATRPAADL